MYGKLKAQIQAFLNPVPDNLYLYPIPNEEDRWCGEKKQLLPTPGLQE